MALSARVIKIKHKRFIASVYNFNHEGL